MERIWSPTVDRARDALDRAAVGAYDRAELERALESIGAERAALREVIAETRDRAADLAAAQLASETLEEDLAETWLAAEREAAGRRAAAEARAADSIRDAEARAAAIVAAAARSSVVAR